MKITCLSGPHSRFGTTNELCILNDGISKEYKEKMAAYDHYSDSELERAAAMSVSGRPFLTAIFHSNGRLFNRKQH